MTSNTNTPKGDLKPCPFCGGRGLFAHAVGESWVICKSCVASSRMCSDEDAAWQAWNTRPHASPAAGPVGEVERLRQALEKISRLKASGGLGPARAIADAALVSPAPVEAVLSSLQAEDQPFAPGGEVEALALQCATEAAAKLWGGAALTPFPTEIEAARIALTKRTDTIEWGNVAEEALGVMKAAADVAAKAAADEIYGRLLATTQDYLEENLRFNIASTLATAERERAAARERVAQLRSLLSEAVWFVADHQEAQPNDQARSLLDRIDAVLKGDGR